MSKLTDKLNEMSPEQRQYTLQEFPAHITKAGQWDRIEQLLTAFDFLKTKSVAGMVHDLLEDCDRVIQIRPDLRSIVQMQLSITHKLGAFINNQFPCGSEILKSLPTTPDGNNTRFSIRFTSQETTELSDPPNGLIG